MIGLTVSHYKILEKLGEGGMGVVYKAQDTKLNRSVALKFLPDRVNQAADAKTRFLQEAQAAAGLNHPNICTIYGVDEHEGHLFMSMEYIEGGTLREKIPFLKINDALAKAVEIGEALQEAHSKGIVHRDIKADNIMLTARGQVKVMDFGLAKLKGALKLTRTSSTVGTLGYMAPEQIQGGEVDHRSDIFSFGVLLFEMLTGKLPFRGEHEAAMVYSIVNEEPQDIAQLVSGLSPVVANLIQRCLEKDPEDRFQTMQDAVIEMRRSQKKTSRVMRRPADVRFAEESPADSHPTPQSTVQRSRMMESWNRKFIYGAAGTALLLAVVLFLWRPWEQSAEINAEMTTRVLDIPLTEIGRPGLSGDGNWVAFPAKDARGNWRVYFMNTSEGDPKAITSDSISLLQSSVDVSFDGSKVAFDGVPAGKNQPAVFIASSLGGEMRLLANGAFAPRWQPDGRRVFFHRGLYLDTYTPTGKLEVWSIAVDGSGERQEFIDTTGVFGQMSLSVSPDNASVAWLRTFPEGAYQEIMIHDLRTGENRQLTFDKKNIAQVCWAANGEIIFSSNKSGNPNLWTMPARGGTERQITKGLGPDFGVNISADLKRLLYYQNQGIGNFWIGDLAKGTTEQITFDERAKWIPVLSPDGRLIAFSMNDEDPMAFQNAIYISNRDGSNRRQVASSPGRWSDITSSGWSPDGKYLSYCEYPPLHPLDSVKTLITTTERSAPRIVANGYPFVWLNADSLLLLNWTPKKTWIASISTGQVTQFFEDSTWAFPARSGKFVVYADNQTPFGEWWIVPVDASFHRRDPGRKLEPREKGYSLVGNLGSRDFAFFKKAGGRLLKMWLTTGKEEVIPGTFLNIDNAWTMFFNPGTNEFIFDVQTTKGKLVMIENPFK